MRHYFGTKQQLFVAGLQVGVDTDKLLGYIVEPGLDGLGVRFVTALTTVYESSAGARLADSFRGSPELLHAFWTMISARLRDVGAQVLPGGRVGRERTLAQVQAIMVGFVHARYVDPTPPVAALSREDAVRTFGALLQAVLSPPDGRRHRGPDAHAGA